MKLLAHLVAPRFVLYFSRLLPGGLAISVLLQRGTYIVLCTRQDSIHGVVHLVRFSEGIRLKEIRGVLEILENFPQLSRGVLSRWEGFFEWDECCEWWGFGAAGGCKGGMWSHRLWSTAGGENGLWALGGACGLPRIAGLGNLEESMDNWIITELARKWACGNLHGNTCNMEGDRLVALGKFIRHW